MRVDDQDKRYRKLVIWVASERRALEAALGRDATIAECRAHAHTFIDMLFDEEEQMLAKWAAWRAAEAAKVVPLRPENGGG
jgi:hypothetical protein